MDGAGRKLSGVYFPGTSLEIIGLVSGCRPDTPAPALGSAVAYVAAYLDGTGSCAQSVRDCLDEIPGAGERLARSLGAGAAGGASRRLRDMPGLRGETLALASLVAARASATGGRPVVRTWFPGDGR